MGVHLEPPLLRHSVQVQCNARLAACQQELKTAQARAAELEQHWKHFTATASLVDLPYSAKQHHTAANCTAEQVEDAALRLADRMGTGLLLQ